jgi:drug/metabolite transporter (DMT)-like permease
LAELLLNNQARGALLIMGAAFLWGTTGVISKITYANTNVGPISLAFYRLVFAVPILSFLIAMKGYRVSITRREVVLFAGFGFFSLTVFESLYFTSFVYTTVQHAAALLYTAPAFVAILSWFILKERLTKPKLIAVGLSITGAFLIVGIARGEPLFASRTQLGDWLAVGAGLAYSSWYIFGKVLGKNREPAVTSLLGMCFGAVFLFHLMIGLEGPKLPQGLFAWEMVSMVGIVPTAAAYVLYMGGLRLVEATKASVFAIVEPVSAAFFGFWFFQETLSYDSFVGFVLIISSILLISASRT